jgi:hypothetical protein
MNNVHKVKIISDSTCDLSPELIKRYDVEILPLYVTLGDESLKDGVDITPDQLYAWADEHKTTPKTAAVTQADAYNVLKKYVEQGCQIVYTGISSEMSVSYGVVQLAAKEFPDAKIAVVDSRNLSTGVGHVVIRAAELAQEGKDAFEIKEELDQFTPLVRASFVVDTITYLYRGGRCSAVAAFGATALNLKPSIVVENGKMRPDAKYHGKIDRALKKYVQAMEPSLLKARPDRVFITHSGSSEETVNAIKRYLEELNYFKEILITRAGCVISSHCGPGTLGVLYVEQI